MPLLVSASLTLSCLLSAASSADPEVDRAADILVEPEALRGWLERKGSEAVILDCRSQKEYEASRIDRARWLDVSGLKGVTLSPDGALAADGRWAAWLTANGLDPERRVLVYDDGSMTDAARVWFLLQYLGIRAVSVLNGGFAGIAARIQAGGIRSATGPAPASHERPVVHVVGRASGACPARLADKTAVRAALAKADAIILDVRTEAEYRGLDQEKNPRRGHLPNSVNIPHTRLLNAFDPRPATQPAARMKGRLKPRSELRALFEAHGITPDRPIITHCQSGGRAALAAMALVVAGYRDVSNYYASFGEWSADPELPVIGPRPSPTSAPAR